MAEGREKLTFGFTKKLEQKQLKDSKLRDDSTKDVEEYPDFVLSVSKNEIESSAPKKVKKELIIPLIVKNNWRLPSTAAGSNVISQNGQASSELETRAVRAILEDARRSREEPVEDEAMNSEHIVPILVQNRVPGGYETDDKIDVTLRADESTLDDYERIPIEEYGVAMLKGMGWKEGQGIGAKNKKVVAPLEVTLRPKGLGLGADVRARQGIVAAKEDAATIEASLAVGSYVRIVDGLHKDSYGQVEGLDMDNARAVVRLTISSKVVTVSEHVVHAVSKNEFKKEGKLINKAKYEEYKAKSDAALESVRDEIRRKEARREQVNGNGGEEKSSSSSSKYSKDKHRSHRSDRHDREHSKKHSTWVRPLLRVRFIDKSFKEGKYFNTKVVIEDVVNKNVCICRTDRGTILEDIPEKSLETVIPRSDPPMIMIVKGTCRGQIGEILEKNKDKCLATVQLVRDREVLQMDYDSICEYVGEVPDDY